MRRYIETLTLALALVLTIAVLAACGMSNNPKKTKASLEEKQYTVETVIGDNDLDAQAELDSMSDEMNITAGELVAMLAAYKGESDDMPQDFIYIYYFKDGMVADRFWKANGQQLDDLKEEYKTVDGFKVDRSGSVVYFGTEQAIRDAM